MSASSLDKHEDERKISTLLYCLGDDANEVLTSTSIMAEERKLYEGVLAKLDVLQSSIYERARFNKRDQKQGESS